VNRENVPRRQGDSGVQHVPASQMRFESDPDPSVSPNSIPSTSDAPPTTRHRLVQSPTHRASWLILTKHSCLTSLPSNTASPSASIFLTSPAVASGGRVERCACSSPWVWVRPAYSAAVLARLDAWVAAVEATDLAVS
jgi:hypothetical protein